MLPSDVIVIGKATPTAENIDRLETAISHRFDISGLSLLSSSGERICNVHIHIRTHTHTNTHTYIYMYKKKTRKWCQIAVPWLIFVLSPSPWNAINNSKQLLTWIYQLAVHQLPIQTKVQHQEESGWNRESFLIPSEGVEIQEVRGGQWEAEEGVKLFFKLPRGFIKCGNLEYKSQWRVIWVDL